MPLSNTYRYFVLIFSPYSSCLPKWGLIVELQPFSANFLPLSEIIDLYIKNYFHLVLEDFFTILVL